VLLRGVLEVGAEDMMAMLDAIDDGGQLAAILRSGECPKISVSCRRSTATGRVRSCVRRVDGWESCA